MPNRILSHLLFQSFVDFRILSFSALTRDDEGHGKREYFFVFFKFLVNYICIGCSGDLIVVKNWIL